MPKSVTLQEVEAKIRDNPDEPLGNLFPAKSFQKEAYLKASPARLLNRRPQDADPEDCHRHGLTREQWAEQMEAVARAREHDAKLSMLKQGVGRT